MLRALIVTYYFPPSGGSGVQRMLKTIKYLPRYGVLPEVLTVSDGAYPEYDASLLEEIPPSVAVHRTRSVDPFRLYGALRGKSKQEAVKVGSVREGEGLLERMASWVRANVFLPDARVGWVPFAKREAARLLRDKDFDVILTSGPPHSTHLIGRYLKRKLGIPWVADFRDPWTEINFYDDLPMTAFSKRRDRRLERKVLTEADHIVTVSPTWAKRLAEKGGRATSDVHVVHNGYDEEDFSAAEPPEFDDDVFFLVHVGSLYDSRDPVALWDVLVRLREENPTIEATLRVQLFGRVGESVRQSIRSRSLEDIVDVKPYVEHDRAIREMMRATILLLSIESFSASEGMITGKFYEYLAAGRSILALADAEGDVARLINDLGAGRCFDRTDSDGIYAYFKTVLSRGEGEEALVGASPDVISGLNREAQAGVMADVLKSVR